MLMEKGKGFREVMANVARFSKYRERFSPEVRNFVCDLPKKEKWETNAFLKESARMPNWVFWTFEDRDGKRSKVPYGKGGRASSVDPSSWTMFPAACSLCAKNSGDGVMFSLSDSPFGALDFDHAYSDGVTVPIVAGVVEALGSYCEISPSGKGLRVFFRYSDGFRLSGNRRAFPQYGEGFGVEAYTEKRFMSFTGNVYAPFPISTLSEEAFAKALSVFGYPWKPASPEGRSAPSPLAPPAFEGSDADLVSAICRSRQGAKFTRLFTRECAADTVGASEDDLALCSILAYWTRDEARTERMWLASSLGLREKTRTRKDYREATIRKAFAGLDRTDGGA